MADQAGESLDQNNLKLCTENIIGIEAVTESTRRGFLVHGGLPAEAMIVP